MHVLRPTQVCFVPRLQRVWREQATGGRCSVHVLRRRPVAAASPFTSLHSAPQRPVRSVRFLTAVTCRAKGRCVQSWLFPFWQD